MLRKIKKIFNDVVINLIATILPILILQFLILPIVSQKYSDDTYGLILTLIGLITLASQALSVSLSNTRLLMNDKYVESRVIGDFNVLLISSCLINIIFLSISTYLYEGFFNYFNIVMITFISVIQTLRRYLLVAFRIKINYKGIFNSNLILILGYLIGLVIFLYTDLWQTIYIVGELLSLIYVILNTDLLKEPIKTTIFFKETSKNSIVLLLASFLGTINTQIDRLLLFPLLGPKMVAIYYVSSLLGKTLSMGAAPINNVMLTYISKMKVFKLGYLKLMLFTSIVIGVFSYIFILLISNSIIHMLYPSFAEEALKLVYITTLTSIISMICTVINPVIMKFCNLSWQIWLNLINLIVFVILSVLLVNYYSILGFCYAALIASIVKLFTMLYVYYQKNKNT